MENMFVYLRRKYTNTKRKDEAIGFVVSFPAVMQ